MAGGIFLDQRLDWCFLHWQADSLPLNHQGSPRGLILMLEFWQHCDLSLSLCKRWYFSTRECYLCIFTTAQNLLKYPKHFSLLFSQQINLRWTLCDHMNCNTPGFSLLHYLLESAQTHVHWISDVIQPSHPLWPSFPFAFNFSQHHGLFRWVSSSHQEAIALEL